MPNIVLAHGPILKTPATVPFRYVLLRKHVYDSLTTNQCIVDYIVYREQFEHGNRNRGNYYDGLYFPVRDGEKERKAFLAGLEKFTELLDKQQDYAREGDRWELYDHLLNVD